MTDQPITAATPSRERNWLKPLLIASLAINLLFGGAAAARFFVHERIDRMAIPNYMQLVPRRFFGELERGRRAELLGLLKNYRERFGQGRQNTKKLAESLADALAAEPYDEAHMRRAVDEFAANGSKQIALGSEAAINFIGRLSETERHRLSELIRERVRGGRRK